MLDGKGVNNSQRLAEKGVVILKLPSGVRGSAAVRFKCCDLQEQAQKAWKQNRLFADHWVKSRVHPAVQKSRRMDKLTVPQMSRKSRPKRP